MNLATIRYRIDPRPLLIFYHEYSCGQVGNVSTLYHCPICQGQIARVLKDPNPEGWDYVCPACSQLVVPFEVCNSPEYAKDMPAGAVGKLIGVPVTLTYTPPAPKAPEDRRP